MRLMADRTVADQLRGDRGQVERDQVETAGMLYRDFSYGLASGLRTMSGEVRRRFRRASLMVLDPAGPRIR